MTVESMKYENLTKPKCLIKTSILVCLASGLLLLLFTIGLVHAQTQWPRMAVSQDGTPISYEVFGTGEPALIFVDPV